MTKRRNILAMLAAASALGVAQPMGMSGRDAYQTPSMISQMKKWRGSGTTGPRTPDTPKAMREAKVKFNGKKPLLLDRKESSFQQAHKLAGGVLMQPWQVKACLSVYTGETPLSFS